MRERLIERATARKVFERWAVSVPPRRRTSDILNSRNTASVPFLFFFHVRIRFPAISGDFQNFIERSLVYCESGGVTRLNIKK